MSPRWNRYRKAPESLSSHASGPTNCVGMYQTARGVHSRNIEYRSAGAYIADMYLAALGDADAVRRQELFHTRRRPSDDRR